MNKGESRKLQIVNCKLQIAEHKAQGTGLLFAICWPDGAAIGLLALLTLAFYRQTALTNLILPGVDALTYFYPYRQYAAQAIRSGHVPLWNPYLFMGVPFLANAQAAVFYPLNLLLCWLPAPRLVTWSIVIHVTLAAAFTYLYGRRALKLSALPALLAACTFAYGGFLSGMGEHINQLNVSVWFPLLLLLWEKGQETRALGKFEFLLGAVVGIGLLAGHTQSSYICLFGLGIYALMPAIPSLAKWRIRRKTGPDEAGLSWKAALRPLAFTLIRLAVAAAIAAGLAAVQLLPTAELSRLSIRGGGLTYREAVAFSLKPFPRLLRYTFLPPWGGNLGDLFGGDFFTEYVAYIGIVPLILAVGQLGGWVVERLRGQTDGPARPPAGRLAGLRSAVSRAAGRPGFRLFVLAGLGVFLALGFYNPFYWLLYKLAPGFGLFRVPARWLFLYAFGAAMLAGMGLERLGKWANGQMGKWRTVNRRRSAVGDRLSMAVGIGLTGIALIELFVASQALPLAHPTAPEAFSSMRTAPAHILAAQSQEQMPGRFLSMSDILFNPGDWQELEQIFRPQLDDQAVYDLMVNTKRKEVLTPNLPLAWRAYAVDGYDGGVLPLQRYVALQRLFLPQGQISPDGRLREQLTRVPPARLLSLLGVRYVITDKVNDAWIEDVFYDLAFEATLSQEAAQTAFTADLPALEATALGIVAYVEGHVADGTPVAEVTIGSDRVFQIKAEERTRDQEGRKAIRLRWDRPTQIERIAVRALPFDGTLHIRGLALIDERDGSNVPVLLSTDGRYRLVHSGDVKVYEVLDALPRAFVVHQAVSVHNDEQALELLADPAFDPAQAVVLGADGGLKARPALPGKQADGGLKTRPTITAYEPETVRLEATLDAPGYLVLTDAWYPGWQATVDGQPAAIERANVLFRAVYLDKGSHIVQFSYKPMSYLIGGGISLITWIVVVGLLGSRLVRQQGSPVNPAVAGNRSTTDV